jgi:hypothetical protein
MALVDRDELGAEAEADDGDANLFVRHFFWLQASGFRLLLASGFGLPQASGFRRPQAPGLGLTRRRGMRTARRASAWAPLLEP